MLKLLCLYKFDIPGARQCFFCSTNLLLDFVNKENPYLAQEHAISALVLFSTSKLKKLQLQINSK